MRLKSRINESTLSTAARSPFPMRGRLVWKRLRRLFYWAMPESGIQVKGYQS